MEECINCKHIGIVSRNADAESLVTLFCKAVVGADGAHPVCGVGRSNVNGKCGCDGDLFEQREY